VSDALALGHLQGDVTEQSLYLSHSYRLSADSISSRTPPAREAATTSRVAPASTARVAPVPRRSARRPSGRCSRTNASVGRFVVGLGIPTSPTARAPSPPRRSWRPWH